MKIAIYSRKSKFTGKGESVENQIEMCKDYIFTRIDGAKEEDIIVYEDEGFSAKDMNRPQFQKMLADTHKEKFDYIVCYRLDRISRNVSDFSSLIEDLNFREINFICIKEQFDTSTPMGRAMMYIASVFAQMERETLAERVKDNVYMLARGGRWLGGTRPTGFTSEQIKIMLMDGKIKSYCQLKINEEEIQVVKIIFQKFLELYSVSGVSKYLIENNIKSRTGKFFSLLGIRQILTNPVYCAADLEAFHYFVSKGSDVCFEEVDCDSYHGLLSYGKREYKGNQTKEYDISQWIIAIGKHPATVTGFEWVTVQNRLEDNKPERCEIKAHNDYSLLSGILHCKKCGAKMFTKIRHNRGKKDMFDYICNSKLRGNNALCDCQNLNGYMTDDLVCEYLKRFMNKDSNIYQALEDLKRQYAKKDNDDSRLVLQAQIEKCQAEIDNLVSSLANATISQSLIEKIDTKVSELEQRQVEYKRQLASIDCDFSINQQSEKMLEELIKKLSRFRDYYEIMTVQKKRELIRSFVKKIEWDGENLYIFIYCKQ